jgi:glycosyltransferase involved in cell wall biosynthesis
LYGGIANNMYVFAKALDACGVDICFIRDRSDRYPFSQPVWEDQNLTMHYQEVPIATNWNWEQWGHLERDSGWSAPSWLADPLNSLPVGDIAVKLRHLPFLDAIWTKRYLSATHRSNTLALMRECDALLVCGIEGSILARLSGRPYIIWPHGGDLMIAAGMLQPPIKQLRQRVVHGIQARHLRSAFDHAICVGNHEPSGISSAFWGAEGYIKKLNVVLMPIPIPVRFRPSIESRHKLCHELLKELGLGADIPKLMGFVPSRIDYRWKGHDRLLAAMVIRHAELRDAGAKIVFTGWGEDLHRAKDFAASNGIADVSMFLDVALSKPMLFRFYECADFAVDQFTIGMYGTAALEAMAAGCPLITWLDDSYDRSWGAPPVINVKTTDQIAQTLGDIANGDCDLAEMGNGLQAWISKMHSPEKAMSIVLSAFENPGAVGRGW